jgi:hypothetical protein
MPQSTSTQWDIGRFLQTLTYFETIPLIRCIQTMIFGATPAPAPPQPQADVLFDFSQSDSVSEQIWGALDDVVMGGVSNSTLQAEAGVAAVFSGNVSTANSGGFASVRTRNFEPPLNLSDYAGIELRVKGDGQRYKFFVRDEERWDSPAYGYSFDTVADQWITVRIPFAQMVPIFRAKTVDTARSLNPAQIRSLQLMLSKFEYDGALNPHFTPGEFRLLVQTIGVYVNAPSTD